MSWTFSPSKKSCFLQNLSLSMGKHSIHEHQHHASDNGQEDRARGRAERGWGHQDKKWSRALSRRMVLGNARPQTGGFIHPLGQGNPKTLPRTQDSLPACLPLFYDSRPLIQTEGSQEHDQEKKSAVFVRLVKRKPRRHFGEPRKSLESREHQARQRPPFNRH